MDNKEAGKAMSETMTKRSITVGPRGYSLVIENSISTLEMGFMLTEEEASYGTIKAEVVRDGIDGFIATTKSKKLKEAFEKAHNLDGCIVPDYKLSYDGYVAREAREKAFEYLTGCKIEEGYQLDHACCVPGLCSGGTKCPHRGCVNPAHLHAMLQEHNVRLNNNNKGQSMNKKFVRVLGGECKNGHEMTDENVRHDGKCRRCNNAQQARYRLGKSKEKLIRDYGQGYDFDDWEMFG